MEKLGNERENGTKSKEKKREKRKKERRERKDASKIHYGIN